VNVDGNALPRPLVRKYVTSQSAPPGEHIRDVSLGSTIAGSLSLLSEPAARRTV
jgi:hypothetical protein